MHVRVKGIKNGCIRCGGDITPPGGTFRSGKQGARQGWQGGNKEGE